MAAAESRLGDVRTRMGSAGADAATLKRREAAVRAERGELMKRAAEKEEQVRWVRVVGRGRCEWVLRAGGGCCGGAQHELTMSDSKFVGDTVKE